MYSEIQNPLCYDGDWWCAYFFCDRCMVTVHCQLLEKTGFALRDFCIRIPSFGAPRHLPPIRRICKVRASRVFYIAAETLPLSPPLCLAPILITSTAKKSTKQLCPSSLSSDSPHHQCRKRKNKTAAPLFPILQRILSQTPLMKRKSTDMPVFLPQKNAAEATFPF